MGCVLPVLGSIALQNIGAFNKTGGNAPAMLIVIPAIIIEVDRSMLLASLIDFCKFIALYHTCMYSSCASDYDLSYIYTTKYFAVVKCNLGEHYARQANLSRLAMSLSDAETKHLKIYVCDVDSTSDGYTTVSDKYVKETVIKNRL
jgi:hypothetical protein